jgi:hypothetical protein
MVMRSNPDHLTAHYPISLTSSLWFGRHRFRDVSAGKLIDEVGAATIVLLFGYRLARSLATAKSRSSCLTVFVSLKLFGLSLLKPILGAKSEFHGRIH